MRKAHRIAAAIALISIAIVPAILTARNGSTESPERQSGQPAPRVPGDLPLGEKAAVSSALVDTYVIAEYGFEGTGGLCDAQGWISVDLTQQAGPYYHVDDFVGTGGDFGRLTPLQGNQSLWCGLRYDSTSEVACYTDYPGYGNNWDQRFESVPMPVSGDVTLSYHIRWDTEDGYDYACVEYVDTNDAWVELAFYQGIGEAVESFVIPEANLPDTLITRFRFQSDGAFSDEDGEINTDGALIIDSLTVADTTGVVDYQDFEAASVGANATADGHWFASVVPGFGDFAGLVNGVSVLQEDPCFTNPSCMWGFFNGSPDDYGCGGHPEQTSVPLGDKATFRFLDNEIRSPWIDWTHDKDGAPVPGTAAPAYFQFDVYADLPTLYAVMYAWSVRSKVNGCPTPWKSDHFAFHSLDNDGWRQGWMGRVEVTQLLPPGATEIQLAIRAVDTCGLFGCNPQMGNCHSHAPLIDNVRLIRTNPTGPIWETHGLAHRVRFFQPFQDNFFETSDYTRPGTGEFTASGKVRMDIGYPHFFGSNFTMYGDSLVVKVTELNVGLDRDVSGGPAAYIHVRDLPGKSGAVLSGGPSWPYVPSLSGGGWTAIQMDSVPYAGPEPDDQFRVDLNDNLYEPGDTVLYYLSARDAYGITTYWTNLTGTTTDEATVRAMPMEVTCLPANAIGGGADILLVDADDGGGTQPYFDYDFELLGVTHDRFDINKNGVGNGLGEWVKDVSQQLIPYYKKIIWSSGSRERQTIGSGDRGLPGDLTVLYDFLDQHPEDCGVYFTGDRLASEWSLFQSSSSGLFRSTFMDFSVVNHRHRDAGEPVSPLVAGQPGSFFDASGGPDVFIAYGGCPENWNFGVLAPSGASSLEMAYSNNPAHGAVLSQQTLNADSATVGVILSGFGYGRIRDDQTQNPYDRVVHLQRILEWLGNVLPYPTGAKAGPMFENNLAQNYPNPFNPSTKIRYSIAQNGRVKLRIYNVAGQVVRSLVDEVRIAGVHSVTWDGRDETGAPVASGVYFYRLVTSGFTKTKKLTVLK